MQTSRQGSLHFTPAAIMASSKLFQNYQRAFALTSGLLPVLRNADTAQVEWSCGRAAPLCAPLGLEKSSCSVCRSFHHQLTAGAERSASNRDSRLGLHKITVPVCTGHQVLALLQIDDVCLRLTTGENVEQISPLASADPSEAAAKPVIAATWPARSISPEQCASLVLLLESFAPQLAEWYVQHTPTKPSRDPAAILRAKDWIETHYHEALTLSDLAKAAHISSWHLSRRFHRATGMTLTEFIARKRIAHVRRLLAAPQATITETAFAVGFRSISQFNRTFHRLVGHSPTKFRAILLIRHHGVSDALGEPRSSEALLLRAAS